MKNQNHDLPRHKRPLWEVVAFTAAFLGLLGLASIMHKVDRFLAQKQESAAPAVAAEYVAP
jgi:hypothetical protein